MRPRTSRRRNARASNPVQVPTRSRTNRVAAPRLLDRKDVRLRVNDREYSGTVEVRKTLVDFLREDLGLTGTHVGCEHGVCGACTIILDNRAVRSCLLFAVQADGARITTVEGLGTPERLHPIQDAFREHHGLQCGFCTPGFLMTAFAFLEETPNPNEEQIREVLAGNLCRCTGYQGIVEAVKDAAQRMKNTATRQRGNAATR